MSSAEFANAVAYGQLTPGPVVQTVAIVGWAAAGLGGALLAVGRRLRAVVPGDRADRRALRAAARSGAARAFLDGAGPAAAGAILGATVPLFEPLDETWQYGVLAGAASLLCSAAAIWALAGGALAGLLSTLG